jgi:hypothetical protein
LAYVSLKRYLATVPKPPKRPRDMMQLAKMVGEIATGERNEESEPVPDEAAVKRGKARAAKLSPSQRTKIAKKAATSR